MIRTIILSFLALSLAGCTSLFGMDNIFRDRGSDYLKAEEMPPSQIPGDLDSDTLGVAFPVPPAGQVSEYQIAEEFSVPRPDELGTEQVGQVRIQRLGEDQWILVPAPPGEVWPRLRNFLTTNRIPTLNTDAGNGVIETGWVSDDGDDSLSHQFRFRLEQGVQLNTTEIVVRVREIQANIPNQVIPAWDDADAQNIEQENSMRLKLAEALAGDEDSRTASLLGQRIGAAAKVEIVTPTAADPYILMRLNYERSWASVEYALGSELFSTSSSDKEAGEFEILVLDEEAQDYSWLRRALRGSPESLGTPYQLLLRRVNDAVEVRITTLEGNSLSQRQAFEVLTVLRSKLA